MLSSKIQSQKSLIQLSQKVSATSNTSQWHFAKFLLSQIKDSSNANLGTEVNV